MSGRLSEHKSKCKDQTILLDRKIRRARKDNQALISSLVKRGLDEARTANDQAPRVVLNSGGM